VIAAADVLRALETFAAEDAAERVSLGRIRALLREAANPFTRAVRDHVTASAVVARPDGSAFLFVHHRRLNKWLQPGGHVEPEDASVFDAARREAAEETGVARFDAPLGTRILDVDVHPIPATRDRPEHVHFALRHLLSTTEEGSAAAPEEIRATRWFGYEDALAEADASLARALRKVRRALSRPTA
jgi:8-oxo-dGTP pyrophosphatase MutT (NUDIX family)